MHTKMESLKLKFGRFFMNNQSSREFVAYSLHTVQPLRDLIMVMNFSDI